MNPAITHTPAQVSGLIGNLQRIQIKIPTDAPRNLNLNPLLAIFSRWRKQQEHSAEWVDLADYAHVPRGAGIVLVGQRCNLSFDMANPAPGILYTAKKGLAGSHTERLATAFQWCLDLAQRLIVEPEFPPGVHLKTDSLSLLFNDRLETPNTPATDLQLRASVEHVLTALYGPGGYELIPQSDPKQCYGFSVRVRSSQTLAGLLERARSALAK
ncbi:MAG: hypothetical protein HY649_08500 [Acidobacteria bacterium]|nr:hypothetical protein [Acidobacteriota bacterium]